MVKTYRPVQLGKQLFQNGVVAEVVKAIVATDYDQVSSSRQCVLANVLARRIAV